MAVDLSRSAAALVCSWTFLLIDDALRRTFCQSNFSFLTGASHPEELVLQADFLRYHAIAITDECSLAGVVRAHTAIKEHQLNIRQIVGSMFWLSGECQCLLLCRTALRTLSYADYY